MKKVLLFLLVLMSFAATAICATIDTTAVSIPTTYDLETILGVIGSVLVIVLGHFAIPSKWTSVFKYVLIILKWLVQLFESVNATNKGENTVESDKDVQPKVQPPTIK